VAINYSVKSCCYPVKNAILPGGEITIMASCNQYHSIVSITETDRVHCDPKTQLPVCTHYISWQNKLTETEAR